jgi:hypothetical protein
VWLGAGADGTTPVVRLNPPVCASGYDIIVTCRGFGGRSSGNAVLMHPGDVVHVRSGSLTANADLPRTGDAVLVDDALNGLDFGLLMDPPRDRVRHVTLDLPAASNTGVTAPGAIESGDAWLEVEVRGVGHASGVLRQAGDVLRVHVKPSLATAASWPVAVRSVTRQGVCARLVAVNNTLAAANVLIGGVDTGELVDAQSTRYIDMPDIEGRSFKHVGATAQGVELFCEMFDGELMPANVPGGVVMEFAVQPCAASANGDGEFVLCASTEACQSADTSNIVVEANSPHSIELKTWDPSTAPRLRA